LEEEVVVEDKAKMAVAVLVEVQEAQPRVSNLAATALIVLSHPNSNMHPNPTKLQWTGSQAQNPFQL